MKLRYTARALREIDEAIRYIGGASPQGAQSVARRIHDILMLLLDQPYAGAATKQKHTRRFVLKPYPYSIFYRVREDEIMILRFRHTSRKSQ